MSRVKFVNLHHHTTFSYGDGFGTPAQHVQRAAELGYTAIAATEHGLRECIVPFPGRKGSN